MDDGMLGLRESFDPTWRKKRIPPHPPGRMQAGVLPEERNPDEALRQDVRTMVVPPREDLGVSMTARYRCCWCGSAVSSSARTMREHMVERHRAGLERALHPLESFRTRKPLDPPTNVLERPPRTNPGVSGEGDS